MVDSKHCTYQQGKLVWQQSHFLFLVESSRVTCPNPITETPATSNTVGLPVRNYIYCK